MKETAHRLDAVAETPPVIAPDTMIIDIISAHRRTETIFRRLEEETGTCVLCQGLFLTLADAARQFGFNLENTLRHLRAATDGDEPA